MTAYELRRAFIEFFKDSTSKDFNALSYIDFTGLKLCLMSSNSNSINPSFYRLQIQSPVLKRQVWFYPFR